MKRFIYALVVSAFCLVAASTAQASSPDLMSSHGDWSVYTFMDKGNKVCFMSSQPKTKEGKYKRRGDVFIFVTRWSNEKDKNVVSLSNGYTFKENSSVFLSVDSREYKLFTKGEMAWTVDQKTDEALTDDIRKGSKMVVKGVSKFGTHTTDTYSLKGSADAHRALIKACAG